MKFFNYLNENFANAISREQTLEILKSKCSNNFSLVQKNIKIFRGDVKLKKDFYFFDKSKRKPRKSANTTNYYTIMLSEFFDSWKNYPRRDLGIICTTSYSNAFNNYGNPYVIIPFDMAKIGICPRGDFWVSFANYNPARINEKIDNLDVKDNKSSVKKFINSQVTNFNKKVDLDNLYNIYFISSLIWFKLHALKLIKNININEINQEFFEIQFDLDKIPEFFIKFNDKFDKTLKNITFGEVLEKIYSPIYNKFSLVNSIAGTYNLDDREVWFDDSAIAIKPEILNSLFS